MIPLLRIKTVIYSDLVGLSHLTVQLETPSGLGANDQALSQAKAKDKVYMSVGVMKDYKLKLRKLRASHTLGW